MSVQAGPSDSAQMPPTASGNPIAAKNVRFKRYITKKMRKETSIAMENMTQNGEILCVQVCSQITSFLHVFTTFLQRMAPSKILEYHTDVHTELQCMREQMDNSYESLCQELELVSEARNGVVGSYGLRDYLSSVLFYTQMVLLHAQDFFWMDWNGDESERNQYMSEAHQCVESIIGHTRFLYDLHVTALQDGRDAKRRRLGTCEPPAGSLPEDAILSVECNNIE